ncbi:ferredoxin [Salipiger aestuarii]|uniref:ferredoxin n=1 Tax=Salipiger aestuarii TaxID=568098 RepID=UPI0012394602|nr:ferredoxin [Salipiger aestuarii]KAA8609165.1 ferredoxin [Salipiger aestuarii]
MSRDAEACAQGLIVRGAFRPDGATTVILLGPDEPQFWHRFAASPEAHRPAPDPLDRWSKRVIGALARAWGGRATFPSDGPPYAPFLRWARQSRRAFESPIGLLVHDTAGLLISYRGAVTLPARLTLPPVRPSPCTVCATRPCTTACPVAALRPGKPYDVAACRAHIGRPEGRKCRTGGCLARRACPLSQQMHRPPAQASFHMDAFMKDWPGTDGGDPA